MVVLLVIAVFAGYVIVDLVIEHRRHANLRVRGEALHHSLGDTEPHWVAGFKLPLSLKYHRGHVWVHWVAPDQAYVGLDDFARRLVGKRARVSGPAVGDRLDQGDDSITVEREEKLARLASPVSGEVVAVNPQLRNDSELVFRDNYVRGWIYKIRSPRLYREIANLLDGSLAERWMEDTRERFQRQLVYATGNVIQDGGAPIEDIASGLNRDDWSALVSEFLVVTPPEPTGR